MGYIYAATEISSSTSLDSQNSFLSETSLSPRRKLIN